MTISTIRPLDWDELRAAIDGEVFLPGDEGYDAARFTVFGDLHPAVVIRPNDVAGVRRVVRLARETGLELAVRSGGHSSAGHGSVEGGIVLDLRGLKAIEVDPIARTATAQTGLTAAEVNAATGEHGLVIGFGDTGSVGIGGLVTGGGMGYLSRKHGLAIDNLLAAQVVTADGEVHEVDDEHEPDLFWAIRGGGGNFGVVTRFTFRLHDLPQVTGGMLVLPATPEIVVGLTATVERAPEELSAIANVMPAPPMPFLAEEHHGKLIVMALLAYAGVGDEADAAIAPLRALAEPLADLVRPMPYAELFPPDDPDYHPTAAARTMFLDRVDQRAAERIIERLEASDAPLRVVQLRPLGGATARVPVEATAYAHRHRRLLANVAAFYEGEDDRPAKEAWVTGLVRDLDQGRDGAYVNFLGDEGPERVRAAYPGDTWRRLRAIKRRYDPTNLFRRNQSIPPAEPAEETFPTDTAGLPAATSTPMVELSDGDRYDLRIVPVAQRIGDVVARRLAYNGSVPGPTLRVQQGSEIAVQVANDGDVEATVHWHGVRVENRYDGVPHETQQPISIGGAFTYRVRFPDAGLYWYHPHLREDYAQDMGLSGSVVVEPGDAGYWPTVDREVVLMVDDVLLEDGRLATFHRSGPDRVAMGRFGNTLLVNGQPEWTLEARRGEVVRFYLTNAANTRVFNLALRRARMKLVGGDSGRYERDAFIDTVLLAPSERAIVDVRFDHTGVSPLEHRTPERTYELGRVLVGEGSGETSAAASFAVLGRSAELAMERSRIAAEVEREPDKVLALVAESHDMTGSHDMGGSHEMGESHGMSHAGDGIEWEDTMAAHNAASDPSTIHWMLVDRQTGHANAAIDWSFRVGERVKIRLVNEMDSDHPMPHPFHIHGAGRFLVLSRGGHVEPNLVWKDTVLVRTGEIVDILLDVSNPGRWMAHCHIAEHAEGGMMFSFEVVGG